MVEMTQWLLEKGADPNITNFLGESAIHKTINSTRPESSLIIVKKLVEFGADTSLCAITGSALYLAKSMSNTQVVEYLKTVKKSTTPKKLNHIVSGPSYDNIDFYSLIGIRSFRNAQFISQSDKISSDEIVEYNDGFNFELGREFDSSDNFIDLKIEDDETIFQYLVNTHENFVNILGVYKEKKKPSRVSTLFSPRQIVSDLKKSSDESQRYYFCISVLKIADNGKYLAVMRTQTGDHRFYIPVASLKEISKISHKEILKELVKGIPELEIKGKSKSIIVNDPLLQESLVKFENNKTIQINRMKIGILYVKKGQTSESEILANQSASAEFNKFLSLIGDIIKLEGWNGYKGDLDVVYNKSGIYSLFTNFRNMQIMFHVSTFLPYSELDEQQIEKKKYIGNDLTTIVFLEEGAVFKPPIISGDFLHIFAVVQPLIKDKKFYKLAFCSRNGVPNFGPMLQKPAIYPAEDTYFRDLLLTKLINGERASLHSQFLVSKMYKTRQMFLQNIVEQFGSELET